MCLHAGNTKEDVDRLIWGVLKWVEEVLSATSRKERSEEESQQVRADALAIEQVQERSKL